MLGHGPGDHLGRSVIPGVVVDLDEVPAQQLELRVGHARDEAGATVTARP